MKKVEFIFVVRGHRLQCHCPHHSMQPLWRGGGTEQGRGAAFAAVDIEEVAGKLAAGGGGTAANPAGVAVDDGALVGETLAGMNVKYSLITEIFNGEV